MSNLKYVIVGVTLLAALIVGPEFMARFDLSARAQTAQKAKEVVPIVVVTAKGQKVFKVELALTPDQRTTGLMFRKQMDQNYGMLFDFETTRPVSMWMKNTFLPLDMVFMDENGRITHIAKDAVPQSLEIISSNGPVRYVLEINAGVADKVGLEPGLILQLPDFSTFVN